MLTDGKQPFVYYLFIIIYLSKLLFSVNINKWRSVVFDYLRSTLFKFVSEEDLVGQL